MTDRRICGGKDFWKWCAFSLECYELCVNAERTEIKDFPRAQVISAPDDITLTCRAVTDPSEAHNLRLQWRRNGDVINPAPASRYVISDDGSQLTIRQSRVTDTATYTCRAENGVDFDTVEVPVTVRGWSSAHH